MQKLVIVVVQRTLTKPVFYKATSEFQYSIAGILDIEPRFRLNVHTLTTSFSDKLYPILDQNCLISIPCFTIGIYWMGRPSARKILAPHGDVDLGPVQKTKVSLGKGVKCFPSTPVADRPWAKRGGVGGLFCLPCRLFFLLWFFIFSPKIRWRGGPGHPGPYPGTGTAHYAGEI